MYVSDQVELFRELQMLSSDYLRQRALYSLQDLVTRYLTEENLQQRQGEREETTADVSVGSSLTFRVNTYIRIYHRVWRHG